MLRISLSAYWSDELEAAIRANCTEPFEISLPSQEEVDAIANAWNQGIDSRLQAITSSTAEVKTKTVGKFSTCQLECCISPEDMPVLIRRLLESEDEEAQYLASAICECLEIELI